MRLAGRIFLGGGVFFLLAAIIYFLMSHDEVGGMALLLTGGLSAMIGFYLVVTARRLPDQAQDNLRGEIWDADPDYGHYSPHSWAPLLVGGSAALTFLGIAFAAWMVAAGAILIILSAAYWLFEYYTGPDTQF